MSETLSFVDLKAQYQRIKPALEHRMQNVFEHNAFIMGPEVAEVEQALAKFANVEHCLTVGNGTDALFIALRALNIGPGDEVITTPFTFVATVETILAVGAIPVLIDIDPATYTINADLIESAINSRTKAIMPVSLYGQCADLKAINAIAAAYQLPVIEDAAQSFGATHHGDKSCSLTTLATTSFFPAKPLGCYGDGGACFTQDANLAEKIKLLRNHGQKQRYKHEILGVNSRLDTLQAAILLEKLAIFPEEIQQRQHCAQRYEHHFKECAALTIPTLRPENTSVYAQYTIATKERAALNDHLKNCGIPTAIHYPIPMHLQPFCSHLIKRGSSLGHSEHAAQQVLSLPLHPYLKEEQQQFIIKSVLDYFHD